MFSNGSADEILSTRTNHWADRRPEKKTEIKQRKKTKRAISMFEKKEENILKGEG